MSFGFRIWNSSNNLIFDSETAKAGCVIESYRETSSAVTRNYTSFAGRTVLVEYASGVPANLPTISYALGYPQVSFSAHISGQPNLAATYIVLAI